MAQLNSQNSDENYAPFAVFTYDDGSQEVLKLDSINSIVNVPWKMDRLASEIQMGIWLARDQVAID